jgi:CRISPR/Cas system-associated exonuclease Cas4 (RecB family)
MNIEIEYYNKKYGDDIHNAFIHLIREIGQIAYAIEKSNNSVAVAKITEASALLRFFATKYEIDLESNIKDMYSKKISLFERNKEN